MMVKRPRYEELEPRILYSADPLLGLGMPGPGVLENRTLQASGDGTFARLAVQQQVTQQVRSHELIVINSDVADWDLLLQDIRKNESSTRAFDVVLLDARQDGVAQISQALASRTDITAIHMISHGSAGELNLGNAKLNLGNLNDYADDIGGWRTSLAADADMLFYGCDVAKGAIGKAFLSSLALLTRADVAASEDKTGDAAKGGDWELEHTAGVIEASSVVSAEAQANWQGLLAPNTAPVFGTVGDGSVTTELNLVGGDEVAIGVALQADGKALVAGVANGYFDFGLVRYNTDGSLDATFGTGGRVVTDFTGGQDFGRAVKVQSDGKILVGGFASSGSTLDFGLARYNSDGSLDTSFGTGGKVITPTGIDGCIYAIAVQGDGKIVAVGDSNSGANYDFGVVRYNADGSLDTTFSGDGKLLLDWGSGGDGAQSVAIQADGQIVIVGYASNGANQDFAIARFNTDGSLDTTFSGDGKQTTVVSAVNDSGRSLVIQADGKLVVAGRAGDAFALLRYAADGSLDTTFDGDGIQTTTFAGGTAEAMSLAQQADGKFVAGGYFIGGSTQFALARYNTDGSIDTTYSGDGQQTTLVGTASSGQGVAIQADGRIVLSGYATVGAAGDFALARYNSDGSLDTTFADNSLNGTPTYTEGGAAVVLDTDVQVLDAELTGSNYAGATLTLVRNGGASSQDVFGTSGVLTSMAAGGNLVVSGTTIGTVTTNSGGTLVLTFNASATQTLVNAALQAITYANSSDAPPASVQIDWSFDDGNTGIQGTGGALAATGSTTVTITALNDAPEFGVAGTGVVQTALNGLDVSYGMVQLADGKIVQVGAANAFADIGLVRYNTDGSIDTTFGSGGTVIRSTAGPNELVRAWNVGVQSNGKIIVGGPGILTSSYDFELLRFNTDGSLDTSFGIGGKALVDITGRSDFIQSFTVQADDKIVVVGTGDNGVDNDIVVVRYNSDGSLDATFSGDGMLQFDGGGGKRPAECRCHSGRRQNCGWGPHHRRWQGNLCRHAPECRWVV